jgi:uncharacterized membrane protein YidH (DUF202 family)
MQKFRRSDLAKKQRICYLLPSRFNQYFGSFFHWKRADLAEIVARRLHMAKSLGIAIIGVGAFLLFIAYRNWQDTKEDAKKLNQVSTPAAIKRTDEGWNKSEYFLIAGGVCILLGIGLTGTSDKKQDA